MFSVNMTFDETLVMQFCYFFLPNRHFTITLHVICDDVENKFFFFFFFMGY